MKSFNKALFGAVLAISASYASANVITDIVLGSTLPNANVDSTLNPGTVSFTHNILDNGFLTSYHLNSAKITFVLSDPASGLENVTFLIGSGAMTQTVSNGANNAVPNGGNTTFGAYNLSSISLPDLQDGLLSVLLNANPSGGNYRFISSTLEVDFSPTSVPEPVSLGLMGIGLFGVAAMRRRAK